MVNTPDVLSLGPRFKSCWIGWLDETKVSCILRYQGAQLILAYIWARPVVLSAGKGTRGCYYFFCFIPPLPPTHTQ